MLINKCSTFVLFDLIRNCGRQTNEGRRLQTTTTEELRQLQKIEYHYRDNKGNRGKSKCSCAIQQIASILQYTTKV